MDEKYKYTVFRSMVPSFLGFDIDAFREKQAIISNIKNQIRCKARPLPTKLKCTDCRYRARHYYFNSYDLNDENIVTPLCTSCKIMRETMGVSITNFDDYILDYIRTKPDGVSIYSIMVHCAAFEFDETPENWNPEELEPTIRSFLKRLIVNKMVIVNKVSARKKIYISASSV